MARQVNSLVLLIFCTICSFYGYSSGEVPVPIDSVEYLRIQHKKVRELISKQKEYGIRTFDDIHTVCYSKPDSANYRTFEKSQIIRQQIDVVWYNLVNQSPSDEFDGRIVTFGLLYSKHYQNLIYSNEPVSGLEEGQVLFFNLRMLSGIKNLAVALEVTRLDPFAKVVEYCYVDHGDTKGTQKFLLSATPEGFTEIKQITKYSCNSRLRDRRLYSFFHERIVKEFFCNIKLKSEQFTPAGIPEIKATLTTQ
jgi:hypothetical protein